MIDMVRHVRKTKVSAPMPASQNTPDRPENHWAIDKRIPVSLIAVLLLQFGYVFYWSGKWEQRVENLEINLERLSVAQEKFSDTALSVAKAESSLASIASDVAAIERRLESAALPAAGAAILRNTREIEEIRRLLSDRNNLAPAGGGK